MVLATTACAVLVQTLGASFNYILNDMLRDLNATDVQSEIARQMGSVGALLVIFIAGAIGQRLGSRRVLLACSAIYAIGCAVVAVSHSMSVAATGLLLANVGKSALLVVALAAISASVRGRDGRATAFAVFSTAVPLAYVFMPVLAGGIVESVGWRWVAVIWISAGCLAVLLVWRLMEPDSTPSESTGEMLTPGLAGVLLAAAVETITLWSEHGVSSQVLVALTVCAASTVALTIALRRVSTPSLDLTPLRNGGFVLLLVVLILTLFPNLFFYMTMALQYVSDLPPVEVALVMTPAQLAAVAGAALSARMLRRWGITRSGTLMMVLVAATLFASALLHIHGTLWLAVVIMCVYSAAASGSGVAVTNAIMNTAATNKDGDASAFRGAAANLGAAIGVAGMTAIVMVAVSQSLQHESNRAGISPATAREVVASSVRGATPQETSSQYAVPLSDVSEIDELRRRADLGGFRAQGIVGGMVTLAGAGLFLVARRRREHTRAANPSTA